MNLSQFKGLGSYLEDRCKLEIAFEYDPAKRDCFSSSRTRSVFAISLSEIVSSSLSIKYKIKVLTTVFTCRDDGERRSVHASDCRSLSTSQSSEVSLQYDKIESRANQGQQRQNKKIKLELLISHRLITVSNSCHQQPPTEGRAGCSMQFPPT